MRKQFIIHGIAITLVLSGIAWIWPPILWVFILIGPLILMGIYDMFQTRHSIKRNFPLIGRGRYILESMGPRVYQYFIESDIEGRTGFTGKSRKMPHQPKGRHKPYGKIRPDIPLRRDRLYAARN